MATRSLLKWASLHNESNDLADKPKQKTRTIHKLRHKFRLVILNDETFKEEFSILLSPLNVFTWGGLLIILGSALLIALIVLTPIKELIPGYADTDTRMMATYAALKVDSLERRAAQYNQYVENLKSVMKGEEPQLPTEQAELGIAAAYDTIVDKTSEEDSLLRSEVERNEAFNISLNNRTEDEVKMLRRGFFFPPIKGVVSSSFDASKKHFGVDVIPSSSEVVKATAKGRVILATWSSETGNIIQIQHDENLISVYKHNSVLLKEIGDEVEAGEAIAVVGNSGELSSGPHLHFEIWHLGSPLNPEDYIAF